jgi:N-acetyl sugar amidotransferase
VSAPSIDDLATIRSEPIECRRCLYDSRVPKISFNADGICNYCELHDSLESEYPTGAEGEAKLRELVERIKAAGRGRKYDCVIGVSGGCDSSYLMVKMKEYGLRPLAVHFDNTWNSTIATMNIQRVTSKLDIDLFTHVVHNKEYDDLYRSMIAAGVADIEAPTDLALAATLSMAAAKYRIGYIIEGHSFRTEGISPLGWLYMDARYVADVHRRHGSRELTSYPHLWLGRQLKWMIFHNIKKVRPLYYMDYDKEAAKAMLMRDFGWQWYGGHHLENRFTAFYHRYFMPFRWGYDTRLLGHAALVRSGQWSRETAKADLATPAYEHPDVAEVVELVKKRLGYSDNEFHSLMHMPRHNYREFRNYKRTFERLKPLFWLLYKLDRIPKSFYLKFASQSD